MMTIKQRVIVLRVAAAACGKPNYASKMYEETATVLEALEEMYGRLYKAALEATQEGRLDNLRAEVKQIEDERARRGDVNMGAA